MLRFIVLWNFKLIRRGYPENTKIFYKIFAFSQSCFISSLISSKLATTLFLRTEVVTTFSLNQWILSYSLSHVPMIQKRNSNH